MARAASSAVSTRRLRRRFAHARELGANFLRLAHYPHHERAAEIADEEGMLLWEELPVYWSLAFDNAGNLQDARNQLSELVLRDRNRASVILWGWLTRPLIPNPAPPSRKAWSQRSGRLIPVARLPPPVFFNQETLTVEDSLAYLVDVVGINEHFSWNDADMVDFRRILDNYDPAKPLLISETGCDIVAGDDRPETAFNSEAFGVAYYSNQIATVEGHPAVAGFVPWLLYDFRTERRQNRAQRGWNRKGLISDDKQTRKQAFNTIAEFYSRT